MNSSIIRHLKVEDNKCSFELKCDFSTANAIRRSLISDIATFSAYKVIIKTNTSCQTDEYIAHRIGMIPFLPKEDTDTDSDLHVSVTKSNSTLMTTDLNGNMFSKYNVPIIKLIEGQTIDIEVLFDKNTGQHHARYSPVSAVEFNVNNNNSIELAFESINGEDPIAHLQKCLQTIVERLQHVENTVDEYNNVKIV